MITLVLVLSILIVSYFGYWNARGMGGYYTQSPMMISHRGVTKVFPENTVEAYRNSISVGYKGIELDVLSSLDGVIYCSHNHELERETSANGYIHQMKSTDMREMVELILLFLPWVLKFLKKLDLVFLLIMILEA